MGTNDENCKCSKCGRIPEDIALKVDLGQAQFPSILDGLFINFNLCDRCLLLLIKSFPLEHQEPILNGGCNTYLSPEDWIRYERGELTYKEKREMGLSV
jgi:hypothetical protein